jgi:hypothetical protein
MCYSFLLPISATYLPERISHMMGHIVYQTDFFSIFTLIHHEQNNLHILYQLLAAYYILLHGVLVHLELDVTLPFDKGSMPWHFSLSARELSEEIGVRIAVKLHALLAAIGIALIGVEKAVQSISHHRSPLQTKVELTDSQAWSTECLLRQ